MITEKIKSWVGRRRESVTVMPVQQQAGALLVLDALDDYIVELNVHEQELEDNHKAELMEARMTASRTGWFPAHEAAEMAGFAENTVRKWGRQGRIKTKQPGGYRSRVEYWVEDGRLCPAD